MSYTGKLICCGAILFLLVLAVLSEVSGRRHPERGAAWAEMMAACGVWKEREV